MLLLFFSIFLFFSFLKKLQYLVDLALNSEFMIYKNIKIAICVKIQV